MNNLNFTIANPLQETIREAEEIITRLAESSERVQYAIATETDAYSNLRADQDAYDTEENEHLSEVFAQAQSKEGPLGGIAKTSKEYDLALAGVRNGLRAGALSYLWGRTESARRNHEHAKMTRMQVEIEFTALRKISELKTAILRAATI